MVDDVWVLILMTIRGVCLFQHEITSAFRTRYIEENFGIQQIFDGNTIQQRIGFQLEKANQFSEFIRNPKGSSRQQSSL